MAQQVARRIGGFLAALLLASLVVFTAVEVLPGDVAQMILGTEARPDTLAALRLDMGLDQPVTQRYADWVAGFVQGDFGESRTYSLPVSTLVAERLVVSVPLALAALTLAVGAGLSLGTIAALRRNSFIDHALTALTQIGIAVPNFWFAMVLVLVFAVNLRFFPAGGFPGWAQGGFAAMSSLVLPTVALALPQAAILSRIVRASLIETLHEDYMRTARAKGLSQGQAIRRHALRNAMIPVLTIMGLQLAFLLAGAIIIENVFALPGLGRLIFQAIQQRDRVVVMSIVLLLVGTIMLINLALEVIYLAVDPRLRKRN
ncbi:MAG: ABC transporter permease [Hyphomicrobiales bacterium]